MANFVKQNKYLSPLFIFLLMSLSFLGFYIAFDKMDSASALSPGEKKLHAHYEAVFQKSVIPLGEDQSMKLKEIEASVVILNFWASWCTPCLVEFPSLVEFNEMFSDDEVKVIGINTDTEDQLREMERIVKEYNLNFVNIADEESQLVNMFAVNALPVSIIFHNGKVINVSRGQKDFAAIEFTNQIKRLLAKN